MAGESPATSEQSLAGGNYEVIRRRLEEQAAALGTQAEALNKRRQELFGGRELALVATERVRTENNCLPRDVVSVAGQLLFGFQVFIGLKTETLVKDVFSLHRFERTPEGFDFRALPFEGTGAFLADPEFDKQFREVFRYYKDARLLQLKRTETRLLIAVQIGATLRDVKVFRFAIDAQGRVAFMDSRGEDDYAPPRSHPFDWTPTTREHQVPGRHPHVNVLNEVFVETVGGDLTVKIENNTADGLGVYREPVVDPNQTLDDAEIAYAKIGGLILLRVKPFREPDCRYLVYNTRLQRVIRIDAVGVACVELPEDHGIVFPGGYYLQSGEYKLFDARSSELLFERSIPSPNGEDVLYVFYRRNEGEYELLPYNLIRKAIANPIRCHGFSLSADGTMLIFRASPAQEATRVHPVQIWQTPFTTAEFAASAPTDGSYLAKVGNADLVAGLSEILSIRRLATHEAPTRRTFEDLVSAIRAVVDAQHWLGHAEAGGLGGSLDELKKTSELIVDEFEKALEIKRRADEALAAAETAQNELFAQLRPTDLKTVDAFLSGLRELKAQRGHLVTLKDKKSIDVPRIEALERAVLERFDLVSRTSVDFFLSENAFAPLLTRLNEIVDAAEAVQKSHELTPLRTELGKVHEGLTLLAETISGLKVDDPTARTRILDGTSSAFAQLNRGRAIVEGRNTELTTLERRAEFAVQFKLLGQSVTSALALCTEPEACDEQLARLMLQLEELEGRFGQIEEFATDLLAKREEVLDAVGARRQTLVEARQKRAANLATAAERILAGITRRAKTFTNEDELNTYFASDPLVQKVADLKNELAALGDSLRADELESKLKSTRQNALRALRDQSDLFEDAGNVIRLGTHRFLVNKQPLELVIVPRDGVLNAHLTSTDFYQPVSDEILDGVRDLWDRSLVSESDTVYRGEYLAVSMLQDAEAGRSGLTFDALQQAAREERLGELVRAYAAERLDEGYERGVHDHDGALILGSLLTQERNAGLLAYTPAARAAAWLFLSGLSNDDRRLLERRARGAGRLKERLGAASAQVALSAELAPRIAECITAVGLAEEASRAPFAARYLVEELAAERPRFALSSGAEVLEKALTRTLTELGSARDFGDDLRALEAHPRERLTLVLAHVDAILKAPEHQKLEPFRIEAALRVSLGQTLEFQPARDAPVAVVTGLLGAHRRVASRALELALDETRERVGRFIAEEAPRFRAFQKHRLEVALRERARLRSDELTPGVLTAFVRNRLIDSVYLPLIGNNLAKQIGAAGDKKRTDLMGLLLLISPPGYGKTTLMEYVANRLGLVFMKINGPALGHDVKSLDPSEAPNATSQKEVEKINLALEMGNNVMLYLDDIQHTNPELLQKFISLCDGQRRIEGVWNGRARTYDLRGKKFCVAMAGNPYTESGARFQIPDMLANRADTYNLGDILAGEFDAFSLSYIENSLTSNSALAVLAGRDNADIYKLIAMARGEEIAASELSHDYSAAELKEFGDLFRRMFKIQSVLLRVNQEYIASASQDDRYRTEPPFKLQGSYRNMNKLAEKVVSAMNDDEIERLIDDHYASESQTLTRGAEQNLLKLAELRGRMTDAQRARWNEIKEGYLRIQRMGGKDDDPVARVTGTLSGLDTRLKVIGDRIAETAQRHANGDGGAASHLDKIAGTLAQLVRPKVEVELETKADGGLDRIATRQLALLEAAISALAARPAGGPPPGAVLAELGDIRGAVAQLSKLLKGGSTPPPARRIEVALGLHTATNFYRPVSSNDVCAGGGLFIATYEKTPPLGSSVHLAVSFPAGPTCEIPGDVAFVQDSLGDGSPAGYGVRFGEVSSDVRRLVALYARHREPLLRDD